MISDVQLYYQLFPYCSGLTIYQQQQQKIQDSQLNIIAHKRQMFQLSLLMENLGHLTPNIILHLSEIKKKSGTLEFSCHAFLITSLLSRQVNLEKKKWMVEVIQLQTILNAEAFTKRLPASKGREEVGLWKEVMPPRRESVNNKRPQGCFCSQ